MTGMTWSRNVLMVLANTFATDTRVRREAKTLVGRGFSVKIVCWDREGRRPFKEKLDECAVRNIRFGKTAVVLKPQGISSSRVHYLIAASLFQLVVIISVVREIAKVRSLVLHSHDFNTLLGSVVAKKLLKGRVRLVYDCHELTPGIPRMVR